jgi:type III pantothenate kinase
MGDGRRIWLALSIGNSRYHWAWFLDGKLQSSWDTAYFSTEMLSQLVSTHLTNSDFSDLFPIDLQHQLATDRINITQLPIYLASVVPSQTAIWQQLDRVKQLTLTDIPLLNLYPSLGIDRALAICGAGENYGYPVLVIDGGTALTFTGIDNLRSLMGGAILPGLRLQFRSLSIGTAALPELELSTTLPARWSNNTNDAIASGILLTITAGIKDFILDWDSLFPDSSILFTGGDGEILVSYMQPILPKSLADRIRYDRLLLFHGIAKVFAQLSLP